MLLTDLVFIQRMLKINIILFKELMVVIQTVIFQ